MDELKTDAVAAHYWPLHSHAERVSFPLVIAGAADGTRSRLCRLS